MSSGMMQTRVLSPGTRRGVKALRPLMQQQSVNTPDLAPQQLQLTNLIFNKQDAKARTTLPTNATSGFILLHPKILMQGQS